MFLTSSAKPIDNQLQETANQIEDKTPSVSVLAARQFCYSLIQIPIEVTVTTPDPLNLIEEFILRAGLEFQPTPNADELATVLGLDSIFVKTTITNLKRLNILESAPSDPIQLTPQGKAFYQQQPLAQLPEIKQIYAISDPLTEGLLFQSSRRSGVSYSDTNNLPQLETLIGFEEQVSDFSKLSLEYVQKQLSRSNLELHSPEEGKKLTSFRLLGSPKSLGEIVSVFVIFETIENQIRLEVRQGKTFFPDASKFLNHQQAQGLISLQDLCQLTDEEIKRQCDEIFNRKNAEVEKRIEKIRTKAQPRAKQGNESIESTKGTAVLLRDSEIPEAFTEVLNSAQHQVLIYSPWINKAVVNKQFLALLQQLANRGVWILIGYGIARRQEEEERPISSEVKEKLQGIKTSQGLPAVQVCWLGNSHAKEIIVDQKVHLCGSQNWLSYRGDYLPRGESVYKVTIPEQVDEAYQFLAQRFRHYAYELWNEALSNNDINLAKVSLSILLALEAEEATIDHLKNNNWLELLPIWLQLVYQSIKSGQLSIHSPVFEKAFELLNQVSENDLFVLSLQQNFQEIISLIEFSSHKRTLQLLNHEEVWSSLKRLGIVTKALSSPEEFLSACNDEDHPKSR
jgi:hypothetical protein